MLLISCKPDHVVLVPAVSYGIVLAARNLPVERDQAILMLADPFPAKVYARMRVATEKNAAFKTIQPPEASDWTAAVLEAKDINTAIVTVENCHWADDTLLDLVEIGEKCRYIKVALDAEGIQSIGAMPSSIDRFQSDFLATASHYWLLCDYSYRFCYVAPKWHRGMPLEVIWFNRAAPMALPVKLTIARVWP